MRPDRAYTPVLRQDHQGWQPAGVGPGVSPGGTAVIRYEAPLGVRTYDEVLGVCAVMNASAGWDVGADAAAIHGFVLSHWPVVHVGARK